MHILHLEDSRTDAELIQALVKSHWPECRITTLTTGEQYETAVEEGNFDLVLSDYTLPGYDGLTALAFLRTRRPDRPFIYISGTIGEEGAIEALKAGASDYVIKDRPARLIPAIRSAIAHVAYERERREAEQKIREQASLLDKAHEAICVTDMEHRIKYWNASAERLYGWRAEEVLGRELRSLLYASDTSRFDAAFEAVQTAIEWRGRLRPERRDGTPLTVESSWGLVTNDPGEISSLLIIDEDITDREKLAAQLMHAQRLESIGLLAGGIAHDLNNVLAPILTSVDLLRERATAREDLEMLEDLEESAQHGVDLVRQLLAFARGSTGQRVEIGVENLVESVRRLLQRVMPPTIEVRSVLPRDLWPVNADATQLRQVLLNLCINARDAMPRGGCIEVRAANVMVEPDSVRAVQGEPKPGPHVRITTSDEGGGIPPESVRRVFDPFFSTKQAGQGTGLGLANVAEIVKCHGGFIDVTRGENGGAAFHLFFPAVVKETLRTAEASPPDVRSKDEPQHILVVEDDDPIRTVLEVILQTRGYTVSTAADGAAALELVRTSPGVISLMLTDVNMPGLSGEELIAAVRALPDAPAIVAMSGLPREEFDHLALEDVCFLQKPLTAEALVSCVRKALEERRAA